MLGFYTYCCDYALCRELCIILHKPNFRWVFTIYYSTRSLGGVDPQRRAKMVNCSYSLNIEYNSTKKEKSKWQMMPNMCWLPDWQCCEIFPRVKTHRTQNGFNLLLSPHLLSPTHPPTISTLFIMCQIEKSIKSSEIWHMIRNVR